MEGTAQRTRSRGSLAPGSQVGRYVLGRRLAKGGMAELYLAKAVGIAGFEKPCVLKLVLPHLTDDAVFIEMFLGEARLAATLDHPNIVHVTDIGEIEGEYFFVMEYVHGRDVRALLRACNPGTLPLQAALTIAHEVCEGLHYVHERRDSSGRFLGLVHRDVSPSNVMVSFDGTVKVVDFGIAKATEMRHATRTGVLKGKVHYMAPEQCEGLALDRRTDVFALGILLYEMTTGRPLFTGTNDYYVMSRIVRGVFARPREVDPAYPPELERIVLRALAREPGERYVSAQALQVDLEAYARGAGLTLSSRLLSETMHDVFGEASLPNFDEDEEESAPTVLHVSQSVDSAAVANMTAPTDLLVAPRRPTRVHPPAPRRTVALAWALGLGVPCLSVGAWAAFELGVADSPAPTSSPSQPAASPGAVAPAASVRPSTAVPPTAAPRGLAVPSSALGIVPVGAPVPVGTPQPLPALQPPSPVDAVPPTVVEPAPVVEDAATASELAVTPTPQDEPARASGRKRNGSRATRKTRTRADGSTATPGSPDDVDAMYPSDG
ncbi:MAG: protein kinase [Nannocystaceae bacterium]|nr:protein kinase [Nannocystaceae bacterium]